MLFDPTRFRKYSGNSGEGERLGGEEGRETDRQRQRHRDRDVETKGKGKGEMLKPEREREMLKTEEREPDRQKVR